jgi:hypothetical protein
MTEIDIEKELFKDELTKEEDVCHKCGKLFSWMEPPMTRELLGSEIISVYCPDCENNIWED